MMTINDEWGFISGYFFKSCHEFVQRDVKATEVAKFTLIEASDVQKHKRFLVLNPFLDFFIIDFHFLMPRICNDASRCQTLHNPGVPSNDGSFSDQRISA